MEIFTAILFSVGLVLVSFVVNRCFSGGRLSIDGYRLLLTASSVFLLAVVAESVVNPVYERLVGDKLWVYHLLPLHEGNVSALAVIVWTAYGIHLYFSRHTMDQKFGAGWKSSGVKAVIFGIEAPLVFEVAGNLFFLQLINRYYAYYLPADVFHLTSFRVVPVYIVCIYLGLRILGILEQLPRNRLLPPVLFTGGVAWLFAGVA